MNFKNDIALVISPHPDDEVLGVGGTIARIKADGGKVYVLFLTVGDEPQYGSISHGETRIKEIKKVMKFLKVDDYDLALPGDKYHLRLDALPQKELIDIIEKKSKVAINKINPTVVFIPAKKHPHQDHVAVYHAALTACRPRPHHLKSFVKYVFIYEQPTAVLEPNFYVDVEKTLDKKLKALRLYKSQFHPAPHPCSPENIKTIAAYRGATISIKYAEAFQCVRGVI